MSSPQNDEFVPIIMDSYPPCTADKMPEIRVKRTERPLNNVDRARYARRKLIAEQMANRENVKYDPVRFDRRKQLEEQLEQKKLEKPKDENEDLVEKMLEKKDEEDRSDGSRVN